MNAITTASTPMTGPLGALPDPVIVQIFSNLDKVSEACSLGQTCKRLFDMSTNYLGCNPCKVPNSPHYLTSCLQRNFKILTEAQMLLNTTGLEEKNYTAAKQLAKTLHPDFKDRMKDHRPEEGTSSFFSRAGVMGVLAEIYTEMLLDAILNENRKKVRHYFEGLSSIHNRYADKLCSLLAEECGNSATWAAAVFSNVRGFDAPVDRLTQAVAAFREWLKSVG